MQQDSFKDFDRVVRSACEGAAEEVPSSVWRAVAARLDAAPAMAGSARPFAAPRSFRPWVAVSLAMAAAVALGVFFLGTRDRNAGLDIREGSALTAEVQAPAAPSAPAAESYASVAGSAEQLGGEEKLASASSVPAATASSEASPAESSAPAGLSANPAGNAAEPAPAETASAAPAASEASQAAAVSEPEPAPASAVAPESRSNTPDPLALLAYEDSRKSARRPLSVVFGGGVEGNSTQNASRRLGASGNYLQDGITETSESTYGVPVTFGVGVRMPLGGRCSIGAGLDYSLLTRSFQANYTAPGGVVASEVHHAVQYLGIPVNLYCNILNTDDIHFYSHAGAEAEYPLANRYRVMATGDVLSTKASSLQWSVGAGLGVEFRVAKRLGLYIDPSAQYYFNCDQPKSIRTEKPFQIVFHAGLRFDL